MAKPEEYVPRPGTIPLLKQAAEIQALTLEIMAIEQVAQRKGVKHLNDKIKGLPADLLNEVLKAGFDAVHAAKTNRLAQLLADNVSYGGGTDTSSSSSSTSSPPPTP